MATTQHHRDTTPAAAQSGPRPGWYLLLGAVAGLLGLIGGLFLGGAAYQSQPAGLPDPGPVVGWGLPIAAFLTVGFGVLTIGLLISAAFLMPSADRTVVSRAGRRDLVAAAVTGLGWSLSALLALLFTHATIIGEDLATALRPDVFFTYAFEVGANVAYAFIIVIGLITAIFAMISVRTSAAAILAGFALIGVIAPPLAAHGSALGDHSLAQTVGPLHALAAALWVGGLLAMARHALRRDAGLDVALPRFSVLATASVIALAVTGVASAYTRLSSFDQLFTTAYGVLVLIKVALLAVLALLATRTRKALAGGPGDRARLVQWLLSEGLLMAVTMGVAVSLSLTAYPRADLPLPTPAEDLLGWPMPPQPTWMSVTFGWYPDVTFLVISAVLAVGYAWAVGAAMKRGVHWPVGRTIAWYAGVLLLVWSTSFGIAGYARVSLNWHMVQHMVLSMMVPMFLVMGMPVMLLLRALRPAKGKDRGPREWLLWFLHSPMSKLVTHPIYVLVIGTFGLFGLYFTPLFANAMGAHLGHVLMNVHFLLSGYLFFWVVLGLDPGPRQVPPWARLMLVMIFISFHAFFAVAIMMATTPFGYDWFSQVQPPWVPDLLADSRAGGGFAWAFGEIPSLVALIVVSVQWARQDDRAAKRHDRQADRDGDAELHAYNARLAAMGERAAHWDDTHPPRRQRDAQHHS